MFWKAFPHKKNFVKFNLEDISVHLLRQLDVLKGYFIWLNVYQQDDNGVEDGHVKDAEAGADLEEDEAVPDALMHFKLQ